MKRFIILFFITTYAVLFAFADGAATFLTYEVGARPIAMGKSFAGIADDAETAFYNVAGAAFFETRKIYAGYEKISMGDDDGQKLSSISFFYPLNSLGMVLGFNLIHLNYGEAATMDEYGNEGSKFSIYEMGIGVSASKTITKNLGAGINIKYVYSHLYTDYIGSDVAFDVGGFYKNETKFSKDIFFQYNVGLSFQNIGPKISYQDKEQADDLLRYMRFGVSGKVILPKISSSLLLSGGIDKDTIAKISKAYVYNCGAEYSYYFNLGNLFDSSFDSVDSDKSNNSTKNTKNTVIVSIRSGYYYDKDGEIDGFSWGFGIKALNMLHIDYAMDTTNPLSSENVNVFSIGADF